MLLVVRMEMAGFYQLNVKLSRAWMNPVDNGWQPKIGLP